MPFVFVLFPLYGVKKEGKVITYKKKKNYSFAFSSQIQVLLVLGKSWMVRD